MMLYLFMFMLSSALYVEGGNLTEVSLIANASSQYWIGLIGDIRYGSILSPVSVHFNTSGVYNLNITVNPSCVPISPYLFFSNSSRIYFPLKAGNLTYLQIFVNGSEGANNTLLNNTSVIFPVVGTLWNVPYVKTRTLMGSAYVYFLQDRLNNIILVVPVKRIQAYNGMFVDYQAMLPLLNRSPTRYTIFFYYSCLSYNNSTYYSSGGGGIPYIPPEPNHGGQPVYLEPSCTYYVSNCTQENNVLVCDMGGCGEDTQKILLPLDNIENIVNITQIPVVQLSYRKSVKQIKYMYVFPMLIVILTALLSFITFLVVISTLPSLAVNIFLPLKKYWKRK